MGQFDWIESTANREKKVTQLGLSGNQEIGVLQLGPSEGSPQETKWKTVIGASGSHH